jgi:hypothetical protein
MNKKIVTIVVVLLVLAVGAYGAYRVVKHFKRPASPAPVTQTENPVTTETAAQSLRDLIAQGVSQSCTYSTDKSQGTLYLSDGKIRGNFNMTIVGSDNQTTRITSHMIIMDSTNYLWTDAAKTGIKMVFDQNATPAPAAAPTPSSDFDANAKLNFKCSSWIADPSLFVLPTDVKFMSLGSAVTVPAGSSPAAGSNSSNCSYCDSLSGDSKIQCLTALKCN